MMALALLMKTMQESLSDEDGKSKLTVTVCKVWLGWKEKIVQILRGTVRAVGRKGRKNLHSFQNEQATGVGRQNLHNFMDE